MNHESVVLSFTSAYWSEQTESLFRELGLGVSGSHETRVNGARLHITPAKLFPLVSTDKYMTSQTSAESHVCLGGRCDLTRHAPDLTDMPDSRRLDYLPAALA
ncbi:hypothetical protein E2C01_083521 [Portunus trituberculatus]|uniref:Uncharacterized protein n=1 Tax=Portunus trituberculatus TaxID=210409 RepID=A0A5B7J3Q7_PORTR|nr:hypothetical protein [Portunus trituberculatus]